MPKVKWFQYTVITVVVAFLGLIGTVIFIANTRQSGVTGLDAMQIQQMRYDAVIAAKE